MAKKNKDPAFLMYSADFLVGTALMTNEQVGMYIRILMHQHQSGHLSKDEIVLICGTYDSKVMSKFQQDENGLYFNERLEEESIKRAKYSESRRNNRISSRNADFSTETQVVDVTDVETYVVSYDADMSAHMENVNENINDKCNSMVIVDNTDYDDSTPERKIIPPTVAMIRAYCLKRGNNVDPQAFRDFYESKGWMIGKNKMKDWQGAVRTWENRHKDEKKSAAVNWMEVE